MQERRFWHPIKHKLLYANLIIYGVNIILLVVFTHELMWAQKTLRAYLWTGDFNPTADTLLIQKAQKYLNTDESPERSEQLLKRGLAIDPYSRANLWFSIHYLRKGDDDKMLSYCDRYRSIDPSSLVAYQLASKVLAKKQDSKRLNQLITEGLKHFRQRVELYQPHFDSNVPAEFNLKALKVYKMSKEGLAYLEGIKKQLANQD
jgi:hypothetical protein